MGGACSCVISNKHTKEKNSDAPKKPKSLHKHEEDPHVFFNFSPVNYGKNKQVYDSDEKPIYSANQLKSPLASTKLGLNKARAGLERAVDVLNTFGSNLSPAIGSKGNNKLSILAFEVACTISKAGKLLQSLSEKNVRLLKMEIFHSEGVRQLVSDDTKVLLSIAAADKREELDALSHEVIRFGNLCKDTRWHDLDRMFSKFDTEVPNGEQKRDEVEMGIQDLATLVQFTSELYREQQALDRFEKDYRRKLEEAETLNFSRRGETLVILQSELKQQRKYVRSLRKKSLWSTNLDEIMEKLVDAITYMNQAIAESFGNGKKPESPESLGEAGVALHYANLIFQIESIASRPATNSLPPNIRDALYHGLPVGVKTALRSRLLSLDAKKQRQVSVPELKAEMQARLQWLIPLATNTAKTLQGFGWVGEWASWSIKLSNGTATTNTATRLQTLHHTNKSKMESHLLELLVLLHRLLTKQKSYNTNSRRPSPRLQSHTKLELHSKMQHFIPINPASNNSEKVEFSNEDRILIEKVPKIRYIPALSKSHDYRSRKKTGNKVFALSRSFGDSRKTTEETDNARALDLMDGLDLEL